MATSILSKYSPVGELADIIRTFIQSKRSLGYLYKTEEGILYRFSLFSLNYEINKNEVPLELVEGWMEFRKDEKPKNRQTRVLCVLQMLEYARKHGYDVHVPPLIKKIHVPHYTPYIFAKQELELFFYASDHIKFYPGTSRHHIIPVLFRLIYSCGLRSSEVANLKSCDVDLRGGIITIREGKNGRDRIIPLSGSMAHCVQRFSRRYNDSNEGYFFRGKYKNKLQRHMIYHWFRVCLEKAGISHLGKGKGPRVHDLRHSFCVHSLKKMQEQGMDLYASLPILSKYVGHASVNATQYYLRLSAEFFPDMMKKINERCGSVIPTVGGITNETC